MPHVEVTKVVPASQADTFALLARMEDFPDFMESVQSIEVLERTETGTVTRWVTRLQGATFKWTERDTFFPDEGRITYAQIEGDLRQWEGEWRLRDAPSGTEITLTVDFEFGMPMMAALLNPIAKIMIQRNVVAMMAGIERALSN